MSIAPPPPEPNERPTRPAIGDWNVLEASIGQRGMGKSTHQCYRALVLARQAGGAYVIGHSMGARLPTKLPKELGGATLPITYHTTIKKLERGLRRHPDRWHILAPPIAGDGHKVDHSNPPESADDLLKFSLRLSTSVRKGAWQQEHMFGLWKPNVQYQGLAAVPIIVLVDEGIAIQSAGISRKEDNRWFLEYIYSLRHNHIALLYSIQDASARSWRILEQATAVHVFAIRHQWALNAIQASGATEDELARIRALDKYQHVTLAWDKPSGRLQRELIVDAPEK